MMMQQFVTLAVFCLLLSTVASGLRCYTCTATDVHSCTDTKSCSVIFNRCSVIRIDEMPNVITKGCHSSLACGGPISCCEGDLCNAAKHDGPSVVLMLVSSALIKLFL